MNKSPEPESSYHRDKGRRKPRYFEISLSFGLTYVFVRSAVSVLALTYTSIGKIGVLFLLLCSLLYFGFVSVLAKWELVQKNAAASWLYWIKGIPGSLALGIVAMIMMVFSRHSWIVQNAYALQVLLVVCALSSSISFLMKVFHIKSCPKMGLNTPGAAHGDMDGWISMNPWARVPFVASYGFDAVVWTWLVIHYRYYSHSFLLESSWIMTSLWILLASFWMHCAGVFLVACRWIRYKDASSIRSR